MKKVGKILLIILLFVVAVYIQMLENEKSQASGVKVLRVIDGDTIEVEADYLPSQLGKKLSVRILGVDTPEKGSRAKCSNENLLSLKAKLFTEQEVRKARVIRLEIKKWDKYGGRVLGDIILDEKRLSELLIKHGHGIRYYGERKIKDWCSKKQ